MPQIASEEDLRLILLNFEALTSKFDSAIAAIGEENVDAELIASLNRAKALSERGVDVVRKALNGRAGPE